MLHHCSGGHAVAYCYSALWEKKHMAGRQADNQVFYFFKESKFQSISGGQYRFGPKQ